MFLTKAEEQHLNGIFLRNKQGSIQLTDDELAMIKTYNGLKKALVLQNHTCITQ